MKYDQYMTSEYFNRCGLPKPTFEHRVHPVRRWRFDLAWIDQKAISNQILILHNTLKNTVDITRI